MVESTLLDPLTQILKDEPRCRGLFLAGSHATGTADAFSDIDLVGVAEPADQAALVTVWRTGLEKIASIVLFRSFPQQQSCLTNAVTADWDRIDLYLQSPAIFGQRAAGSVLALHDPDNRLAALQAVDRPDPRPKVAYLAEEFLRVLGLLHVAAGRGDYVTAATGAGLLRDHLIALLRYEVGVEREGALHLSRSLSPQDMAMLYALPVPQPERASVLAAHLALAGAFIPRARAILASLGLPWPATLEDATRRRLIKSFGAEADIIW
jgi:Streptomycin adenylyltransferase